MIIEYLQTKSGSFLTDNEIIYFSTTNELYPFHILELSSNLGLQITLQ